MDEFWTRCVDVGCVVVPVRTYSAFGSDGNIDESLYVGIRFVALPFDDEAVGPAYWIMLEESLSGADELHLTPEAALDAFTDQKA